MMIIKIIPLLTLLLFVLSQPAPPSAESKILSVGSDESA